MAQAYLMNRGGARFDELVLVTPPTRTDYVCGWDGSAASSFFAESFDPSGMKIAARIGGALVTLTGDNYTISPSVLATLSGGTITRATAVTVSATLLGLTRTLSIPVTVTQLSTTLDDNTWRQIFLASRAGAAAKLWSVGDVKYDTVNGVRTGFRILGFDHDKLSANDYSFFDDDYNADDFDTTGVRHAGITFQWVTAAGTSQMHTSLNNNYSKSRMHLTALPGLYNGLPADMKAALRTVTVWANTSLSTTDAAVSYGDLETNLFLLAAPEVKNMSSATALNATELENDSVYTWYAENSGSLSKGSRNEWLRSPHAAALCSEHSHYGVIRTNGDVALNLGESTSSYDYYPAFCV